MSILYYRDHAGANIAVMLNEVDAWAVATRSAKGPIPAGLNEFSGTKITREEAVDLVGEDHVLSAEHYVRSGQL